ncbi:MAG: RNA polymerase sigma factor [Solirubrobacteraceae bacterium]
MSPATLRRYRAERLLRRDFQSSRASVLRIVRARLGGAGRGLDDGDLEACYATAWQGLYAAVLQGEEIANPRAWLVLVTHRRAIEEHRARLRRESRLPPAASGEPDLDGAIDDRLRLRQLMEGMRSRLSVREQEAAALCYLQGYTRAQAARQMGISETRMRKLMEGRGEGRRGVAAKVGALVETIRDGAFCQEQASLMRALAYGVLDPAGDRYRLAVAHSSECPACRHYVASLRGLAAVLPPVLWPAGLAAVTTAGLAHLARLGARSSGARRWPARWVPWSRAGAVPGRAGPLGASAATAGGAAGGGWTLGAGGLGAKLAVGCLIALGLGAGCGVLGGSQHGAVRGVPIAPRPEAVDRCRCLHAGAAIAQTPRGPGPDGIPGGTERGAVAPAGAAGGAGREFGLEQGPEVPEPAGIPAARPASPLARSASAGRRRAASSGSGAPVALPAADPSPTSVASRQSGAAEREFAPG